MYIYVHTHTHIYRLPRWPSGKEFACQCRRHGFNRWSGKIPHTAEQLSLEQLLSLSSRALKPLSLYAVTTEAHALQQEKLPQ